MQFPYDLGGGFHAPERQTAGVEARSEGYRNRIGRHRRSQGAIPGKEKAESPCYLDSRLEKAAGCCAGTV